MSDDNGLAFDLDVLKGEVSTLLSELEYVREQGDEIVRRLSEIEADVRPWIGLDGQARIRLERLEQAMLALTEEPSTPYVAAAMARRALGVPEAA